MPKWLPELMQQHAGQLKFVLADPVKTPDFMRAFGLAISDTPTVVIHEVDKTKPRMLRAGLSSQIAVLVRRRAQNPRESICCLPNREASQASARKSSASSYLTFWKGALLMRSSMTSFDLGMIGPMFDRTVQRCHQSISGELITC